MHINSVSSKANQTVGVLKETYGSTQAQSKTESTNPLLAQNLNTAVQFVILNASAVARMVKKKTAHRPVDQLEKVQRWVARWVTGHCHNTSSVTDMLQRLDWRTLEQRRVDSRLCMLYKIRNHLIAIEEEHYVQRGTGRCSHQYRQ